MGESETAGWWVAPLVERERGTAGLWVALLVERE